ncbi:MAG: ACT domain-containing protein [Firmicutes bacterium]|nr:ACT domain-containing protein [Bacillota bacterium]
MYIKQISVFLENTKGTLHEMMQLLGEHQINILAISLADTSGFGIVRLVVKSDDIDKALKVLADAGDMARVNDVVGIRVPHQPLGLATVLGQLDAADISIEYAYSFCRNTSDDAVIILRVNDAVKCAEVLQAKQVPLVAQADVDKF